MLIKRFDRVQMFNNFFENLVKKIDEYFLDCGESKLNEITIWFIYRFLNEESKRVIMEKEINDLLIDEFNVIFDAPLQVI